MIPFNFAVQRWQPTKPDTGPLKIAGWLLLPILIISHIRHWSEWLIPAPSCEPFYFTEAEPDNYYSSSNQVSNQSMSATFHSSYKFYFEFLLYLSLCTSTSVV